MPNGTLRVGNDVINSSKDVRNLGIKFDDMMSMSAPVTNLSRSVVLHTIYATLLAFVH